jgi:hypothetical protein
MKSEIIERAVKTALAAGEETEWVRKVPVVYDGLLALARKVDNPYLRDFTKLHQDPRYTKAMDVASGRVVDDFNFERLDAAQEAMMRRRTHKYSWAVPTPDALATIAEHSPIVEAGAGTGYWAHLLRQMNVDVVAFDRHGMDVKLNRFHKKAQRAWTDIVRGTADTVSLYPERTLFMSFPPPGTNFANDVLTRFQGNKFLYIGDSPSRLTTANEEFHSNLARSWREVKSVPLPNWETSFGLMQDKLHLFTRI